jgi:TPR repeat protein
MEVHMNIYLLNSGKPEGPMDLKLVKENFRLGTINLSTLAAIEGDSEWRALKDIPEIMSIITLPPTPPPILQGNDFDNVSLDELKMAAENGDAECQCKLGLLYCNGSMKDDHEAVKWFLKSAEQGNVMAQSMLGIMYGNGCGVPQDFQQASMWTNNALEKIRRGNEKAENISRISPTLDFKENSTDALNYFEMGRMYARGQLVPQDYHQAKKMYMKAADMGNAEAQFDLGVMYYAGQGVNQSYTEAMKWFRQAAEKGLPEAQFNLAVMYYEGRGVVQNYTEALKWYRQAADQGNADAQFNLGVMYGNGFGVIRNDTEAMKWFKQAADQGKAEAQIFLKKLK